MVQNPFSLQGEVALITGGATGLGFAMSQCLAYAGASVVMVGRREEALQDAVHKIGTGAKYECFDVTEVEKIPELMERIEDHVGSPTILINNAGIHLKKWAVETTDDEFLQVLNTHVRGAFALTRAVAPNMLKRGHGSILFIEIGRAHV